MPNVKMKTKDVPVFELYINNWEEGKVKHKKFCGTEYYMNFPGGKIWSVGSGCIFSIEEMPQDPVYIYRLKSDRDFQIATENLLNSEWCSTEYKKIPTVSENSNSRDVYILFYRYYPELYLVEKNILQPDILFNVAVRYDEDHAINNWLVYSESGKSWFDFNPIIKNVKKEVIGWIKTPCKIAFKDLVLG